MDIRSKYLALILCAGTVLSLAACGGDGDVAGDDWRTTGLVAASGTITHDGQSVDVVVTVDEESAAFYWDRPEQLAAGMDYVFVGGVPAIADGRFTGARNGKAL